MLIEFFNTVKKSGVNVSLKELLDLIKALDSNLINRSTEDFYFLSRSIMVKDEKYYDKFDKAFGIFFKGIESIDLEYLKGEIPEEWLRKQFEKTLSKDQRDKINNRLLAVVGRKFFICLRIREFAIFLQIFSIDNLKM